MSSQPDLPSHVQRIVDEIENEIGDEPNRPERLVWQDHDTVAFAPFASRSPFEVWIVPRRHDADFGRATDADVAATGEA